MGSAAPLLDANSSIASLVFVATSPEVELSYETSNAVWSSVSVAVEKLYPSLSFIVNTSVTVVFVEKFAFTARQFSKILSVERFWF